MLLIFAIALLAAGQPDAANTIFVSQVLSFFL